MGGLIQGTGPVLRVSTSFPFRYIPLGVLYTLFSLLTLLVKATGMDGTLSFPSRLPRTLLVVQAGSLRFDRPAHP